MDTRAAIGRITFAAACFSELATFEPAKVACLTACPPLLRYVALRDDEDSLMGLGSVTFPEFLRGDCVNLRSVRGVASKEAERSNSSFITKRRDALRTLLRAAAHRGVLPWGTTRVADFSADNVGAEAADFIDLDEDLAGDSEFNPIVTG
jgi:hypothetical protein